MGSYRTNSSHSGRSRKYPLAGRHETPIEMLQSSAVRLSLIFTTYRGDSTACSTAASTAPAPYGVLIADMEGPVSGIRGAVPIIHNSAQAFLDARDARRQSLRSCILPNVGIHFFQPVSTARSICLSPVATPLLRSASCPDTEARHCCSSSGPWR
jgi:hypothetical protein